VDRVRSVHRRAESGRRAVLHGDSAAERHRRSSHRTRARLHAARRRRAVEKDAGPRHPVAAGDRPRGDRHAGGGRARAGPGRHDAPRPRARGIRAAGVGLEGDLRGEDPRSVAAARCVGRLEPRAVHAGRGSVPRGPSGFRPAVPGGTGLPRPLHRELVPEVPHGAVRPRDRPPGRGREAVHDPVSRGGRRSRHRTRHDAARDPARRHGRGRAPGRRALPQRGGQEGPCATHRPDRADRGRCVRRSRVRHRRGEAHAEPRSERLPRGAASGPSRARGDRHPGADDGRRRAVRRARPLRSAQAGPARLEGAEAAGRHATAQARGRPLPALWDDDRAAGVQAVVRQGGTARRTGDRGRRERPDPLRSRQLVQDLFRVDAQHPRLVHLPPAVVGAPHPGVVLRWTRGSPPRCGRSRRWDGPIAPRTSSATTRRAS